MRKFHLFLSGLKPTRFAVLFAVLIGFGVGFWQWIQPPQPRLVLENLGKRAWTYFSPDGKTLAIISGEFSLDLWDIHTGQKKINLYQNQNDYPRTVAFSPDGRTLAGGFLERKIRLWEVASGRELATYENQHWYTASYLTFSPQGTLRTVRGVLNDYVLCNVAENKIVARLALEGEWDRVFPGGGSTTLVLIKGDVVKVWDLATATLSSQCQIPRIWHFSPLEITPHHRYGIGIRGGGWETPEVFVFDLATGEKQKFKSEHSTYSRGAAMAPDGQTVALGWSGFLKLPWWNWFQEWLGKQEDPYGVVLAPQYHVALHAFPSGEELLVLKNCTSPIFAPDGKTLAVIGADGTSLQLWDLPIRKPIGKILGLAGLAAVATLLVFQGLGWLRRRRMRLKANVVPNFVPSTK